MQYSHPHRPQDEAKRDASVVEERDNIIVLDNFRKRPNASATEAVKKLMALAPGNKIQTYQKKRDHLQSEMIFLKDRDPVQQRSSQRMEACDLIAAEMFPIDRILNATDPEDNRNLFDAISTLRTIYVNQLINLDCVSDEDLAAQRGLARIELIRFLLIKTEKCYRNGLELNKENIDDRFLTDTELRLEIIQNDIRRLLREAFAIGAQDASAFEEFKDDVTALVLGNGEVVKLPTEAPELYKNRANRKEKPTDFIKRVYGQWLERGLLRPHIKSFDEQLYRAFYKHGIPPEFDTLLPKASGQSVKTKNLSDAAALELKREQARNRSRRLYQNRKQTV